ncbi:glycosyltransferase family 2 protein [Propionicicella superfundia]|uniref:glycosyltransferase family 2 protein n=1 Tax=Propionicicella superfundia TaxID=348582 RepID=UPI00040652D0|nr:glycosyltransferase family 2 protein [Propionicicella superfundia]
MPDWPPISVIMPVRNEERHLAASVGGIVGQDYPGTYEIVMAVGPSDDRTEDAAAALAAEHSQVRVVPNPTGRTPAGLNLAIAASRYDILVRVDGHGELAPGYLRTAVRTLQETGAANVGGVMDARGETPLEEAVAVAYNSRLGLGGSSFHLRKSPPGPAQTVFLGVFDKARLLAVGGFDETMYRAQDWELNHRLIQAGETVWFTPELTVTYRPRSTLRALARQMYNTGKWRREVIARYPETASLRYLAPPLAVAGVLAGTSAGLAGLFAQGPWRLLSLGWLAPLGYVGALAAGIAALHQPMSGGARVRLPLVLAVIHGAWGWGFLRGLSRAENPRLSGD